MGKKYNGKKIDWQRYDEVGQFPKVENYDRITAHLNTLRNICYADAYNAGWHTDLDTGELLPDTPEAKGLKIALIHSEISEALEGERKGLMDDKLPHRLAAEVEFADAIIRILDYCGRFNYDIGGAVHEKLEFNRNRADHKIENRKKDGGKKF